MKCGYSYNGWSSCCGGGDGEGVLIGGGSDLACRRLACESIPLFITAVHFLFGLLFPVQCVMTSGHLNHFAECVRFPHESNLIFQSVWEAIIKLEAEGGVSPGYSGCKGIEPNQIFGEVGVEQHGQVA